MNARFYAFLIALLDIWRETARGLEVGGLAIDSKTRMSIRNLRSLVRA